MNIHIATENRLIMQHAGEAPGSMKLHEKVVTVSPLTEDEKMAALEKEEIRKELQSLKKSLPSVENMQYRNDGLVTSFQHRRYTIDCTRCPLGRRSIASVLQSLQGTLKCMEEASNLDVTRSHPRCTMIDDVRLEFDVLRDGKSLRYVATPYDVLRILSPGIDFSTGEERRSLSELRASAKDLSYRKDSASDAKEFNRLIQEEHTMDLRVENIEMKTHGRILFDEVTGREVREYQAGSGAGKNTGRFVYMRESPWEENVMKSSIAFNDNGRSYRVEYRLGEKIVRAEDFRNGRLIARHAYENGVQRIEHIIAKEGTQEVTHVTVLEGAKREALFPVSRNGKTEFLSPFGVKPLLSEQMDLLLASLQSKELYDRFEELYWEQFRSYKCANRACLLYTSDAADE